MRLTELLDRIDEIELARGGVDGVEIREVVFDSRKVEPGALFVALVGSAADGHAFVDDAVEAGAAAVLVEDLEAAARLQIPVLVADDTRRVLGRIAEHFFARPSMELSMVGITGTNGKTTTAWMVSALFEQTGRPSGLIGTIAHRWDGHVERAVNTTPESLVLQRLLRRMRDDGVEQVALEVSSHGLATHRLVGTHFDAAVFTNLSRDHLDFHGDMEAYRDAKARLFTELLPASKRAGKDPVAVINVDDEAGRWMSDRAGEAGVRCTTYALDAAADCRARVLDEELAGTRFRVEAPGQTFEVTSPLLGRFNVSNALAAVAVGLELGLGVDDIRRGLDALPPIPGRMQRVESKGGPTLFVDYAHSPDALERALETLA
ncbi:MAG: Mur ligase family protein, partial [Persicimonas sp.]